MAIMLGCARAEEEAPIGAPAPGFTLPNAKGGTTGLADAKGKFVVLEWINHDCPFVRKHYDSGNMQKLQRDYTAKGAVWYSVCSSAPGKQGYLTPAQWQERLVKEKAVPTAMLLDADGKVGRLYGAKTTPHLFVIDPAGKLVYRGAIDDKPSVKIEDVATARAYLVEALDAAMAGKPVPTAATQPYGCSVKY
jgi:peroxiredoxin